DSPGLLHRAPPCGAWTRSYSISWQSPDATRSPSPSKAASNVYSSNWSRNHLTWNAPHISSSTHAISECTCTGSSSSACPRCLATRVSPSRKCTYRTNMRRAPDSAVHPSSLRRRLSVPSYCANVFDKVLLTGESLSTGCAISRESSKFLDCGAVRKWLSSQPNSTGIHTPLAHEPTRHRSSGMKSSTDIPERKMMGNSTLVNGFGARLKERREQVKMDHAALAGLLGETPSTIASWEEGDGGELTLAQLSKIADALGTSIGALTPPAEYDLDGGVAIQFPEDRPILKGVRDDVDYYVYSCLVRTKHAPSMVPLV